MRSVTMTDIIDFTPTAGAAEVHDFSIEKPRVQFKLDGDVFTGVRDIPAVKAMEFSGHSDKLGRDDVPMEERIAGFLDILRLLLVPESAELFISRLSSPSNPIGVQTMLKVVPWLFEQYSLRPTTPDSDSSTGSGNPESGTNSTVSTSGVASTS
jgi:hypothetical protein